MATRTKKSLLPPETLAELTRLVKGWNGQDLASAAPLHKQFYEWGRSHRAWCVRLVLTTDKSMTDVGEYRTQAQAIEKVVDELKRRIENEARAARDSAKEERAEAEAAHTAAEGFEKRATALFDLLGIPKAAR